MIQAVFVSLLAGIAGLWIAKQYIPGVGFSGSLQDFLIAGAALGIGLALVRPLLNFFSFILRTLFLLVAVGAGLWLLSTAFPSLQFTGLEPFALTALAITGIIIIASFIGKKS